MDMERSGGEILIDQLIIQGADRIFGVPGESYLHALDALYDRRQIEFVICRQEGGAAMMAEADGKLTGRPGLAFVTRGPGASNATSGLHVAMQDSTPMILFVGQIERGWMGREAFQEIDYAGFFHSVVKWAAQIEHIERIPEMVHRAYATAMQGRPGPVVLALPEDLLGERAMVQDLPKVHPARSAPDGKSLQAFQELVMQAEKPLMVLGGGGWCQDTRNNIEAFCEKTKIPVTASFRRQDYLSNNHSCYAGDWGFVLHPELDQYVRECDLLIAFGTRLGEVATKGYERIGTPKPRQRFIHVHASPEETGRVYHADLGIISGSFAMSEAMLALAPALKKPSWEQYSKKLNSAYLAWREPPVWEQSSFPMGEVIKKLVATLPEDALITNGAGNYAIWANRFFPYQAWRSQLAPTSGSMGYGLPAAIAAAFRSPERPIICFAGDGCLMMTCQELATAAMYNLPLVILVFDNAMYGTIRMHQERHYPGRVSGTALQSPDFADMADALGLKSFRPTDPLTFEQDLETALKEKGPCLIHIKMDPREISPTQRL